MTRALALGLPLKGEGDGYYSSGSIRGFNHFGVWPLWEAAEACFGTPQMTVRDQILHARDALPGAGPVSLAIGITTGPGRNWANIWKPLIDAFGPVLGEDPERPFHPNDDRIVSLGLLHHHVNTGIGHDVMITAWWMNL